jgi:hypothetical protein
MAWNNIVNNLAQHQRRARVPARPIKIFEIHSDARAIYLACNQRCQIAKIKLISCPCSAHPLLHQPNPTSHACQSETHEICQAQHL